MSVRKKQFSKRIPNIITVDNRQLDYEYKAEGTDTSNYQCRDCGDVFDTLEAHDKHHRTVHSQTEVYLIQGMTM